MPPVDSALLPRLLPFLRWWPRVGRTTLRADLVAGLLGAIIVLPQGVAFATLAGLPPQYGLYAAMVPTLIAALWGSSRHLVSGPTNAISLVVFATLGHLAPPGTEAYVGLALTLSLMVGAIQLAMGLARLGALVNFISHTVIVAFTAGAALLIIGSQVRHFLGLEMPAGLLFFRVAGHVVAQAGQINPWVVAVGATTLASALLVRRLAPQLPYMIVAMLAGGLLAAALNARYGAEITGIRTLGALPAALPPPSLPHFHFDTLRDLLSIAVAVSALGLAEAVAIARAIGLKSGQHIDANQEFVGQGLSNLAGAFFSAYPSSGSFNRSGLNHEAGAATPLASVFAVGFLVLIVLAVAPLAAHLPIASVAAVLFLVAWGLFDFHHIGLILRSGRSERAVLLLTFAATLVLHLELAVLVGVTLSMMFYLARTSQPALRTVGPDPADPARKFAVLAPGAAECPQLKILRIEGSLYFGAVPHVAEFLQGQAAQRPQQKHLLLMAKSINFVDVAGADLLAREARARRQRGGSLAFYSLRAGAEEILRNPDYATAFDPGAVHASKHEAIAACVARLDPEVCRACTARVFSECADRPGPAPATMHAPAHVSATPPVPAAPARTAP